jgi:hypothetical protein
MISHLSTNRLYIFLFMKPFNSSKCLNHRDCRKDIIWVYATTSRHNLKKIRGYCWRESESLAKDEAWYHVNTYGEIARLSHYDLQDQLWNLISTLTHTRFLFIRIYDCIIHVNNLPHNKQFMWQPLLSKTAAATATVQIRISYHLFTESASTNLKTLQLFKKKLIVLLKTNKHGWETILLSYRLKQSWADRVLSRW